MEDIILVENNNLYNILNKEIKLEGNPSIEVKVERIIYEGEEELNDNFVKFDVYKDHIIKEELIIGPEVIQEANKVYNDEKQLQGITGTQKCTEGTYNVKCKKKTSKKKYVKSKKCTSNTSYNCKQCSETFPSNQARSKHYKACHITNACPGCGKVISKMGNLNRHLQEVCKIIQKTQKDKEKPQVNNRYICDICKSTFTYKSSLTTHIRNHLGISEQYKCDLCDKTYNKKHNLKCHFYATHTESYLYRCRFCVREFNWKFALECHEKKVHGKKKNVKKNLS